MTSKRIKAQFLVCGVLSVLLGAFMLIIPGRLLQWLGWMPIDPVISRVLGAALLALAWSSYRGWQGLTPAGERTLMEVHFVFSGLAAIGILRHLIQGRGWLPVVWIIFILLALFAVAWLITLLRERSK